MNQPRDTVVSVRLPAASVEVLDLLVRAGLAGSRSEAAAHLVALGIRSAGAWIEEARRLADRVHGLRRVIMGAVRAGDVDRVRSLLEHDPELANAADEEGESAVIAAVYARARDVAELLLARGARLTLHEAAAVGDVDRLRRLLEEQPDAVHDISHDGWTPLHLAAHFGHGEAVELLLAHGADLHARSRNELHNTALNAAVFGRRHEVVRLLLDRGADPNVRQRGGWTPLHRAAFLGDGAMVELLLQRGAAAEAQTDDGRTAEAIAREQGHASLADRLARPRRENVPAGD